MTAVVLKLLQQVLIGILESGHGDVRLPLPILAAQSQLFNDAPLLLLQ